MAVAKRRDIRNLGAKKQPYLRNPWPDIQAPENRLFPGMSNLFLKTLGSMSKLVWFISEADQKVIILPC